MSMLDDIEMSGIVIKRGMYVGRRDITSRGRLSNRNFVTMYNHEPPLLIYDATIVDEIGEISDKFLPADVVAPWCYRPRVLTNDAKQIDLIKVRGSDWLTFIRPWTITGLFKKDQFELVLPEGASFRLLDRSCKLSPSNFRIAILYPNNEDRRVR